jgi:AcrR family transcriptional regulator
MRLNLRAPVGMPTSTPTDSTPAATRRQLLDAAAVVFAERGFHHATVRDICRIAHANVAAIRYHFGDKEALYAAVLRETAPAPATPPESRPGTPSPPPAEQLHAFIHAFLSRIAEDGVSGHHGCIMAREMVDPTGALDALVQEFIRPQHKWLQTLVRRIAGPGFTPVQIRRVAHSIVSQVLFYKHCHAVIQRLSPGDSLAPDTLDALADHITRFSLSALSCLKPSPSRRNPTRRTRPGSWRVRR